MEIYQPGTMIGNYEVVSKPMMGGMGVVYFCLDHGNDGRPVALKTFRPELLPDREARDRFLREGTAWVNLGSHPHIVKCNAVEYIDPVAFLSLELIAKEQGMEDASLRSWMWSPMNVEQALLFALQIARGLQHATTKIPGFVHRDLKPENVLVGADKLPGTNVNRLRVTDFGLSTMLKNEDGVLSNEEEGTVGRTHLTRGIIGTPLYMAPEQWNGDEVGVFTDVYALGCVLYEMLTAKRIVDSGSISDLRSAHCEGKLRLMPENLPHEVKDLLNQFLSVKPTERYQKWGEVTQEVEKVYVKVAGIAVPVEISTAQVSREEIMQEGWSHNAIGLAYYDMGKAEVAKGYFEKSLLTVREIGDRIGEGNVLGNLGLAYADLGEVQRAIEYYEQALTIFRGIGDKRGEGITLGNLGVAHKNLGEIRRAVGYYEQNLEIARELGDRLGEAGVLNNMGEAHRQLGEVWHAIEYYEQSLTIKREIGDRRGEGNTLGNLGVAYYQLGEVQHAIGYHEQYLAIAHEIGDRRGEGNALGNLGLAYANLGEVRRAIGYYEQCLELHREIGNRHGEGAALNNIGEVHRKLGEVQRAIGYYEHALAIDREIGDRQGEGVDLSNLGAAYYQLGEVQRANEYYEQRIEIALEIGDIDGVAITSFNMAMLYAGQGESLRALPLAQEAERIFAQIGSPNVQAARQLVAELQGK